MIPISVSRPIVSLGFVGLPLDLSGLRLPPQVAVGYFRKEEFHVTLIGAGQKLHQRMAAIHGMDSMEAKSEAFTACKLALSGIKFSVSLKPEFFWVDKVYEVPVKHARASLIASCEVEGSEAFYDRLAGFTRLELERPPLHVTLYTRGDSQSRQGIGLATQQEFSRYARGVGDSGVIQSLSAIK